MLAVAIALILGLLVGLPSYGSEVLARSRPTLLDLGIAIAAGGISGYAKIETKISGSLAGTAFECPSKRTCHTSASGVIRRIYQTRDEATIHSNF
ncbi:hypothetical protein NSTC731_04264 [Nostoc sp. DSM 114167]|jgi:hypothetical protein